MATSNTELACRGPERRGTGSYEKCLTCGESMQSFLSFGEMPIANRFLTPDEFETEQFFALSIGFCTRCLMVQLTKRVDSELLFHEDYAYFSSTSKRMASHFESFAAWVMRNHLKSDNPFVVEIGSNDGIMLQHFAKAGIRHLGVDPSANVVKAAEEKGVRTICRFFNEELAREIVAAHGQADAFLAANVMCHIPDLQSAVAGIRILLKPDGLVAFEDPYLGDVIEKTSYDQVYDEHVFYFCLSSISNVFEKHGLEVIDILPQNVHGGSMRYIVAHKGTMPVSENVGAQRLREANMGLTRTEPYDAFRQDVEHLYVFKQMRQVW